MKESGIYPSTGKTILEKIDGPWPCIEDLRKTFERIEGEFENDGLNDLCPFGSIAVDDIKGVVKDAPHAVSAVHLPPPRRGRPNGRPRYP